MSGFVTGAPKSLLRLENLMMIGLSVGLYTHLHGSWVLFAALFLVPDLALAAYLAGSKVGSIVYNTSHWYGLPFACIALGAATNVTGPLLVGLIWVAHIGMDRALGYGLKYASGFGDTHLGNATIGRAPRAVGQASA